MMGERGRERGLRLMSGGVMGEGGERGREGGERGGRERGRAEHVAGNTETIY